MRLYFPLLAPPIDNCRDEMRERAPKIEIHDDDDGDGGGSFGAEKVQFAFLLLLLRSFPSYDTAALARSLAHSLTRIRSRRLFWAVAPPAGIGQRDAKLLWFRRCK